MRTMLLLPMLLAACSQPTEDAAPPASRLTSIAGLYERAASGDVIDRICLTAEKPARFGLSIPGEGTAGCTARGEVSAQGAKLALRIDGAPACDLRVTTTAAGLTLEAARGRECAYYCGPGASMIPGAFIRTGTSAADIRKVADLVGEPLC